MEIPSTNDGHFEKELPLVLVGISIFFYNNVSLMIPIEYPSNIKNENNNNNNNNNNNFSCTLDRVAYSKQGIHEVRACPRWLCKHFPFYECPVLWL